jgi:hypothetical protein
MISSTPHILSLCGLNLENKRFDQNLGLIFSLRDGIQLGQDSGKKY